MLSILRVRNPETLPDEYRTTESLFNTIYEEEWFEDDFVKEMVLGIDKSEVVTTKSIWSPVFDWMNPNRLSGGLKACILMYKRPDLLICATQCGDNCSKWIQAIGSKVDVKIILRHCMVFKEDDWCNPICLVNNDNKVYNDFKSFYKDYLYLQI